ncbi:MULTISPECIES: dihydrofolate reductase family protein [Arthrobacter]|uniref:dihydrofolate reductase family protein n=1 Tax=Arthrobacter TaxID=1663 RepID=UPI00078174A1|nr:MULTISPECIES: dihydrofolate reductase family protein [Arthrobacter]
MITPVTDVITPVTDVVMGRKLWLEWSHYWPRSDDDFSRWINPVRKHVLSSTVAQQLPWDSTRITGDPVEYLKSLRGHGDGGILVSGGVERVRSLFLQGLIDELILTTHPVVTNDGRRLFDDTVPPTLLELLHASSTSSGNVIMHYALRQPD